MHVHAPVCAQERSGGLSCCCSCWPTHTCVCDDVVQALDLAGLDGQVSIAGHACRVRAGCTAAPIAMGAQCQQRCSRPPEGTRGACRLLGAACAPLQRPPAPRTFDEHWRRGEPHARKRRVGVGAHAKACKRDAADVGRHCGVHLVERLERGQAGALGAGGVHRRQRLLQRRQLRCTSGRKLSRHCRHVGRACGARGEAQRDGGELHGMGVGGWGAMQWGGSQRRQRRRGGGSQRAGVLELTTSPKLA